MLNGQDLSQVISGFALASPSLMIDFSCLIIILDTTPSQRLDLSMMNIYNFNQVIFQIHRKPFRGTAAYEICFDFMLMRILQPLDLF